MASLGHNESTKSIIYFIHRSRTERCAEVSGQYSMWSDPIYNILHALWFKSQFTLNRQLLWSECSPDVFSWKKVYIIHRCHSMFFYQATAGYWGYMSRSTRPALIFCTAIIVMVDMLVLLSMLQRTVNSLRPEHTCKRYVFVNLFIITFKPIFSYCQLDCQERMSV